MAVQADPIGRGRLRRRAVVATLSGVVAATTVGTVSWAYFSGVGSGSGAAHIGSPISVTITATSGPADLFPGHSGAVWFTLHNPNSFTTNFNSVTAASITSGSPSTCSASNVTTATLPFSISPQITVSPGTTTPSTKIGGLLTMSAAAPSQCQGVQFTVSLTLTGQSS